MSAWNVTFSPFLASGFFSLGNGGQRWQEADYSHLLHFPICFVFLPNSNRKMWLLYLKARDRDRKENERESGPVVHEGDIQIPGWDKKDRWLWKRRVSWEDCGRIWRRTKEVASSLLLSSCVRQQTLFLNILQFFTVPYVVIYEHQAHSRCRFCSLILTNWFRKSPKSTMIQNPIC